jgi:hypothetical protein
MSTSTVNAKLRAMKSRIYCCYEVSRRTTNPVVWFNGYGDMSIEIDGTLNIVDRRTARLLAKRINQALDAWKDAK